MFTFYNKYSDLQLIDRFQMHGYGIFSRVVYLSEADFKVPLVIVAVLLTGSKHGDFSKQIPETRYWYFAITTYCGTD